MSLPVLLAPGTRIGSRYLIGTLISSGGFGAVYRGVDIDEGNRPCAIKETYDVTPSARRQALIEAGVLFTVRSKHLPEVYDAFEANGRFYLVMQLIEGDTLLRILSSRLAGVVVGEQEPYQRLQGPCSEQEVLTWLLPIMDVLQELHSRRPAVIHRDIKPGNIILTPDQTAVLVDFGLTKLYDPNSSTQTLVKAVSAGFSPIEQYVGNTGPPSDIYAMAATMYLLLTNRLPPAAIHRGYQDDLIAPRRLNPALSPKTERILLKALSVNAHQRYQSMHEFAEALQEPAFSGYNDETVAISATKGPIVPVGQTPASTGTQHQPVYPPSPSGYILVPESAVVPAAAYPLPSAYAQGCLWGLVQAVLSALLVVLLKSEVYFYLATVLGFLFYVMAGFMTTRKGGSSLRGSLSGFWAGIISASIFWVVLGIGLVIRTLLQFVQGNTYRFDLSLPFEITRAWQAALPTLPHYTLLSTQPPWVSLLFLFAGGLLLASVLGWVGGRMGTLRYKASITRRKYP